MTNTKSTKRALLSSVMALILCFTMLLGSTFAWFTDTATSTGNRIVAGTLDVQLLKYDPSAAEKVVGDYADISNGSGDIFSEDTPWEPGMTQVVYLAVRNAGNLDLKYQIALNIADNGLAAVMDYAIVNGAKGVEDWETWADVVDAADYSADLPVGRVIAAENGMLEDEGVDYFALAVHMDETAGNEYQGKDIAIDVAVLASQLASEEDAFGKDYDAGATLPANPLPDRLVVTEQVTVNSTTKLTEEEIEVKSDDTNTDTVTTVLVPTGVKLTDEAAAAGEVEISVTPATNVDSTVADKIEVATGEGQTAVTIEIKVPVAADNDVPVKVTMNIGKGLTDLVVLHEGDEMNAYPDAEGEGYLYNVGTGDLTIYSKTFSPFTYIHSRVTKIVEVSTMEELLEALAGDAETICVTDSLTVAKGETVEIDLNGKIVTQTKNDQTGAYAMIDNQGTLTINDSVGGGKISYEDATPYTKDPGWASNTIRNTGTLTVNGGTIENLTSEEVKNYGYPHAIDCYQGSVTTINGGTIKSANYDSIRMFCNSETLATEVNITGGTIINRVSFQDPSSTKAGYGILDITGGTFVTTEGVTANVRLLNFSKVCSNMKATVTGGTFDKGFKTQDIAGSGVNTFDWLTIAEAGDAVVVITADDLVAALEEDKDVYLLNDIKIDPANMSNAYGTTGINVKNGQTIDGNGYTLDIKGAGGTWDSGINTTGGVIKNLTVTGSFRGIFINHNSTHSETVVLENVTTTGTVYTISCDQGLDQGLEATGCTFKGWTSFAATLGSAKFTNCTFEEGSGYAYCRPYAPTEFVGCDFEEGFTLDARAAVTFEKCTIGGEALTAENLATLVTSGSIANASVK